MFNKIVYRDVSLSFARKSLLDDIQNYSFVEGDMMAGDNELPKHYVQDICGDGNIDRVQRVIELGLSEVEQLLFAFVKEKVEDDESRDNGLTESDSYTISMSVPADFAKSTLTYLSRLIHEYIVCRVLADWYSITNVESVAKWEVKMREAKEAISTCIHGRVGYVRRKTAPF